MERFLMALPGGAGRFLKYTTSDFAAPAPHRLAKFPGYKTLLDILEFDDGGAQTVFMNVLHADRVLLSETNDYKPLLYSDAAHRVPREGIHSVLLKDGYQIQPREKGEEWSTKCIGVCRCLWRLILPPHRRVPEGGLPRRPAAALHPRQGTRRQGGARGRDGARPGGAGSRRSCRGGCGAPPEAGAQVANGAGTAAAG